MNSEYIEERNGGYYIAGTRILLDSIVYSFERGNSPEAIHEEFPLLRLPQIYGAIAFYLDHQTDVDNTSSKKNAESTNRPFHLVKPIQSSGAGFSVRARN